LIHVSVGNTFTPDLLTGLTDLSKPNFTIEELFGSVKNLTPTARSADRIPYLDLISLENFVIEAKRRGMLIAWTLNANCVGNLESFSRIWEEEYLPIINKIREVGVRRFIISHPLIMKLMRSNFPDDYLEVSTIAEVDTPMKVHFWHDIGASAICGKHAYNRQIGVLFPIVRETKKLNMPYRFIVNELCLLHCPYRTACYLASSHNSNRSSFGGWPFSECSRIREEHPEQWLSSPFILPQWLPNYEKMFGPDLYIKIVGRTATTEEVLFAVKAYSEGNYSGNLLDLWPGINRLCGKDKPLVNIPCSIICSSDFFKPFLVKDCGGSVCGSDCRHCLSIMDYVKYKESNI